MSEPHRGFPEISLHENRHADWRSLTVMIGLLELGRRNVAEWFKQAAAVFLIMFRYVREAT